ncbi:VWA domain-containing protein [Paenibacillus sp. NFR01]|uniref:vWA domain-containing protein n=1 Tax=Paenibacillus sp. NFR01 TaxID=1566279 RepID=UPI001587850F|nr:VWA domain-containing protein [Paenibacillus sp. NFR01]
MFCGKCGTQASSSDLFCKKCGYALEGESEFKEPAKLPQLDAVPANEIQRVRKQNTKSWKMPFLVIVAVLLLAVSAFAWLRNGSDAVQGKADTARGNFANPSPSEAAAAPVSTDVPDASPSPVPAEPAYIKVNQVDSSRYGDGKVDVYFSLFADQEYQKEIEQMSLSKEMFKVNGQAVQGLSLVEDSDTVSVNLVIDKSGSMQDPPTTGVSTSKMDLVRLAAIEFIDNIPAEAKGQFEILSFSSYVPSVADIPFTSNRNAVSLKLSGVASDGGQTALYDSLTKALYDTNEQQGPKYVIAFTDGKDSNYGSSVQSVIDLSKQLGIPIYMIGFGEEDDNLSYIAQQTGGEHFFLSVDDDLQTELSRIYDTVFQRYVKQYKLTYLPSQKVTPGQEFSFVMDMNAPLRQARTASLTYKRRLDSNSIDVENALFNYQVHYAQSVNLLDFSSVQGDVQEGSQFYNNLKKRIEVDYVNANAKGTPKVIDPLVNYRVDSISPLQDGAYKIRFFKFFPVLLNNKQVYEADLNTYTLVRNGISGNWQVSDFGRDECSIYRDRSDPGSLCTDNGVKKLYSGNPWPN